MAAYMNPARRLHIKSTKNSENPLHVSITDADTGERIENVHSLEIMMNAHDVNKVKITYCVASPDGKIIDNGRGKPILEIVEVEVVEVDVVAIEEIRD